MIVLFKILTLFHFKAIRSSWLTLNEILIVSMAKGTQWLIRYALFALCALCVLAFTDQCMRCVPLAIKRIMIVLFKIFNIETTKESGSSDISIHFYTPGSIEWRQSFDRNCVHSKILLSVMKYRSIHICFRIYWAFFETKRVSSQSRWKF